MGPAAERRSESAEIDSARVAFEQAWLAAQSPRIEDYLPRAGHPQRDRLLHELLLIELRQRSDRGQTP